MKRILTLALLLLTLCTANAQERRPIDNRHPAWLIHIDVWNNADPQKIINLIPDDIKPYVILNLSLSCSYDKDLKLYQKPQNAILTYRSWASVCCQNNMWFTCQPASGGHTHIQDDAAHFDQAIEIHESFFKDYPNFLGWNYAEQFWGFDEPNDASSSKQADRIKLFSKLVPMHHQYGGFLTISFCGNIWSHALNPIGMLKRNNEFMQACQKYPEAMLFLYKYTTSSCWYSNESVSFGPFVSGLAKNYGVRYDNCGWNGMLGSLLGDNHGKKYPAASGIAPVLEQTALNGACVWDGPELIWTEDFRELSSSEVGGYKQRNWGTYPTFDNIWIDMFRKIIDGTIYIPSREEVVERTKIAITSDTPGSTSNSVDTQKYNFAMPDYMYRGLYQQTDPANRGNGTWHDNMLYFKSTGRYATIPLLAPVAYQDALCKTITRRINRSAVETRYSSDNVKIAEFNKYYPAVSTGDLFVARFKDQLVCYYPYSYFNSKRTASASIPLQYNSCKSLDMELGLLSSALVREFDDHLNIYLNNYRSDTTTVVTDRIVINGVTASPSYTFKNRAKVITGSATAKIVKGDAGEDNSYVIEVKHCGPCDLTIQCQGDNTELLTDRLPSEPLNAADVKQPDPYIGDIIIEGEDLDWIDTEICKDQYNSGYRTSIKGHSGMGFARLNASAKSALSKSVKINHAGTYTVQIKYLNQTGSSITIRSKFNTTTKTLTLPATSGTEWKYVTFEANAKEGVNSFTIQNPLAKSFFVDAVCFTPSPELVGISGTPQDWEDADIVSIHSLAGQRLPRLAPGINIVRLKNGQSRKVFNTK